MYNSIQQYAASVPGYTSLYTGDNSEVYTTPYLVGTDKYGLVQETPQGLAFLSFPDFTEAVAIAGKFTEWFDSFEEVTERLDYTPREIAAK